MKQTTIAALATVGLSALLACLPTPASAQLRYQYRATLSGDEVVPPTDSPAQMSVGAYWVTGDICQEFEGIRLVLSFGFSGLVGEPTELRLFSGIPGQNGDQELVLASAEELVSGSMYQLDRDWPVCELWKASALYLVLATTAFPAGEIRGQLMLVAPQPLIRSTWGATKAVWGRGDGRQGFHPN